MAERVRFDFSGWGWSRAWSVSRALAFACTGLAVLVSGTPAAAGPLAFEEIVLDDRRSSQRMLEVEDVDGDGAPDIAYVTDTSVYRYWEVISRRAEANLLLNDETGDGAQGVFGTRQQIAPVGGREYGSYLSLDLGDIDGDGDLDFLTGDPTAYWFHYPEAEQIRDDNLRRSWWGVTREGVTHIADLDANGELDVAWRSNAGQLSWRPRVAGVYPNNDTKVSVGGVGGASDIVLADLTGDAVEDVIVLRRSLDTMPLSWLANDGAGNFSPEVFLTTHPGDDRGYVRSLVPVDMDGDGDRDLVLALDRYIGGETFYELAWYENTGGLGSFGPIATLVALDFTVHEGGFDVADLDGDGDPDIVLAERYRDLVWFEHLDGAGGFGDKQLIASYAQPGRVRAVDFDLDGAVDIVATSRANSIEPDPASLLLFRNLAGLVSNGDFEAVETLTGAAPTEVENWSGDLSVVVGEESPITPFSGDRMARFDGTTTTGTGEDVAQLYQILDLESIASEIPTGSVSVGASAWFNRVDAGANTDEDFRIQLDAYPGTPDQFPTLLGSGELATAQTTLQSDSDPNLWEQVSTGLILPPTTGFVVVSVWAIEDTLDDEGGGAVEFDGHYVDQVEVEIVYCGNGILETGEQCDDGNLVGGDCCSATCGFETLGSSCSDGSLCTTGDVCDGAGICLGAPVLCDDADVCTADTCDPATGSCSFDPIGPQTPRPQDLIVANPTLGGELVIIDPVSGVRRRLAAPGAGTGPVITDAESVGMLDDGGIAVRDDTLDAIVRVDRATGDRTILASSTVGSGPWHNGLIATDLGRFVMGGSGGFSEIDPATGDRTTIGPGINLRVDQLAVEANGDVLFISYFDLPAGCFTGPCVMRMDAETGAVTALSSSGPPAVGSGDPFPPEIFGLAVERDGSILATGYGRLFRIDPVSGQRTLFSGGGTGSGDAWVEADAVDVSASGTIWVSDTGTGGGIFSVDPDTGHRTRLADPSATCGGPSLAFAVSMVVYEGVDDLVPGVNQAHGLLGGSASGDGMEYNFVDSGDGVITANPTRIEVEEASSLVQAPADVPFELPDGDVLVWDLDFSGSFTGEVVLTIPYDENVLDSDDETFITVYHYVEETGGCSPGVDCGWIALEIVSQDTDANTITIRTPSFSQFVVGLLPASGTRFVYGLAVGGTIDFSIGLHSLSIVTSPGDSAVTVAAAMAAAINADPTLQLAGVSASASGNALDASAAITSMTIGDPGLWTQDLRDRQGGVFSFAGTALGGFLEVVVDGVILQVFTAPGDSPADVAQAVADAINAESTLVDAGVGASALDGTVSTNGVPGTVRVFDDGVELSSAASYGAGQPVGDDVNLPTQLVRGDFNGDGRLDAVVGQCDRVDLYLNQGSGGLHFTQHAVKSFTPGTECRRLEVAAGDFDADGALDVVAASDQSDLFWYENDGAATPGWTERSIPNPVAEVIDVDVVDLDRDGRLDIVVGEALSGGIYGYANDGASPPGFTRSTVGVPAALFSGRTGIAIAPGDVDSDGDVDLMSAVEAHQLVYWYESDGASPPVFTEHVAHGSPGGPVGLELVDHDGDGDLDAVVTEFWDDTLALLSNQGEANPTFVRSVLSTVVREPGRPLVDDLDRNGAVDVMVASARDGVFSIHPSDGGQLATDPGAPVTDHPESAQAYEGESGDFDGDGDVDLITSAWYSGQLSLHENTSVHRNADFGATQVVDGNAPFARGVHVADVDGDGALDVVAAENSSDRVVWYESDGASPPGFVEHLVSTAVDGPWYAVTGDMDGDGDLDIVSASEADDQVAWHENDGASPPGWTSHTLITTADAVINVAVADVNRDGHLDVLSASYNDDAIRWYENDGSSSPSFTTRLIASSADGAEAVAVADLDGDGDPDVVSASYNDNEVAWYENDGASPPGWTARVISSSASGAVWAATADVDGDGDVDVLAAAQASGEIRWFENDGASPPAWTSRLVDGTSGGARSVTAVDFDHDGDLDLLSAASGGNLVRWHESDGASPPAFTSHDLPGTHVGAWSVAVGDLDGDGDADALAAVQTDSNVLWWENAGGQFGLETVDLSTSPVLEGATLELLEIDFTHHGRPGDHDLELDVIELLFEESDGDPLATAELNGLVEALYLYRDEGSGSFEEGLDTVVTLDGAPQLAGGVYEMGFSPFWPEAQIAPGDTGKFFLVADMAVEKGLDPPTRFQVTHLTESSSRVRDAASGAAARAAFAADLTTAVVVWVQLQLQWFFSGTADGGTIDWTVDGVPLQIVTTPGMTGAQVAAAVAQAINDESLLVDVGVGGVASGQIVLTNGLVENVVVTDTGITYALGSGGAPVPGLGPWTLGVLVLLLVSLTLGIEGRRGRRAGR